MEQAFAASAARMDGMEAAAEEEKRARGRGEAEAAARVHKLDKALTTLVAETASRQDERGKLTDDAVLSLADRMDALEAELAEVAKRPAAPPAANGEAATAPDPSLDDLYVAFEDRFRGARELIKERQAVYLPLLEECGAGTLLRPILDVGCGRGEWLELLRDRDLVARGVDLNAAMVEVCRGMGLDAAAGDAVEHLAGAQPGSLGAVTGFHIIEHLPFKVFVRLLDEALRALAPGGAIVFETPNPDNLLVGSRNFYLDPTHRNPMPSDMTVMIAEARGFARVHARPLHPMGESFGAEDKALGERLDGLFYGPQDYALVAWKP
jgi:SAM-dependent methyltransferase